ncbi:MAG: HD domain-containing protein [bacterium]|nr:HD domain-containing protein [bacterium]
MTDKDDILKNFSGRKHDLEQIKRYSMFPVMYYRTNLYLHSLRVSWLIDELEPIAVKTWRKFKSNLAKTLSLVHDDAEIITGDIQLGHKLEMSAEQLARVVMEEEKAIKTLSIRFPPKINCLSYKTLLIHALKKDCLEAQLVSLADKLDAYGESMHELFAGNKDFITPCTNYIKILKSFPEKYPQLKNFFKHKHPFLSPSPNFDLFETALKGHYHTPQSIKKLTICPRYNLWKEVSIKKLGKKGVAVLTNKNED